MSGPNDDFGRVMSVDISRSGNIFVADDLNRHVVVFGPTGEFIRHLGRQGKGPESSRVPGSSLPIHRTVSSSGTRALPVSLSSARIYPMYVTFELLHIGSLIASISCLTA